MPFRTSRDTVSKCYYMKTPTKEHTFLCIIPHSPRLIYNLNQSAYTIQFDRLHYDDSFDLTACFVIHCRGLSI
jgi:hypothetical protein